MDVSFCDLASVLLSMMLTAVDIISRFAHSKNDMQDFVFGLVYDLRFLTSREVLIFFSLRKLLNAFE